jgi:hypothetical protein
MANESVVIRLEGVSGAEAGIEAQRLREAVLDSGPGVSAAVQRTNDETMDGGAALLLQFAPYAAPAIIAVARGLAGFIRQRGERAGDLVVERRAADGSVETVRFTGDSADAAKIAEALRPVNPAAGQA